jgi:hypothetical protein
MAGLHGGTSLNTDFGIKNKKQDCKVGTVNNEISCNCFKWNGNSGGDLTNVQRKAIQNCHNECPHTMNIYEQKWKEKEMRKVILKA